MKDTLQRIIIRCISSKCPTLDCENCLFNKYNKNAQKAFVEWEKKGGKNG